MDSRLLSFITVVEKGSFSLAAKKLYLSQPAVTMQINSLASQYGLDLFQRGHKELRLSEAGKRLYQQAKKIMAIYGEIDAEMAGMRGTVKGELLIGAGYVTCEYVLPNLVGAFKRENPLIDLTIRSGNYERLMTDLAAGDLDVAIVAGHNPDKHYEAINLLNDELVLIASARHPWADQKAVAAADLVSQRFIMRERESTSYRLTEAALKKAGVSPDQLQVVAQIGSFEAIKRLVIDNTGIAFVSRLVLDRELHDGSLCIVRVKEIAIPQEIHVVYRKTNSSVKLKKFAEFCACFRSGA